MVFIHSGALHNTRLEPTALSRWLAGVVEPAAEALSGGFLPGPRGGSAASRWAAHYPLQIRRQK